MSLDSDCSLSSRSRLRSLSHGSLEHACRDSRCLESGQSGSLTPTQFLSVINDTLYCNYEDVTIEGEVASFKVNQGKWVFFDLKDEESNVPCFMPLWDLRTELEDGMKVVVRGTPKVTKWGKFSVTVKKVAPVGEGSLKKVYELLKKKLTEEGLFDAEKKRPLPEDLTKIGVISSVQAAGYADFVKILNARWGGMKVLVAHTQVQGLDAPDQIMRALRYFNERSEVQVIAILRGGGSADDLACFNDEALVRAVAASKIPVICGVGHEIDESLCDLACDVRASTPSNAAEMLTPRDRASVGLRVRRTIESLGRDLVGKITAIVAEKMRQISQKVQIEYAKLENELAQKKRLLEALNPDKVLARGYAIISGKISPGGVVKITTSELEVEAEIKKVKERS